MAAPKWINLHWSPLLTIPYSGVPSTSFCWCLRAAMLLLVVRALLVSLSGKESRRPCLVPWIHLNGADSFLRYRLGSVFLPFEGKAGVTVFTWSVKCGLYMMDVATSILLTRIGLWAVVEEVNMILELRVNVTWSAGYAARTCKLSSSDYTIETVVDAGGYRTPAVQLKWFDWIYDVIKKERLS